ncbi:hypothetical protein [Enterococcus cecorum]|uniref:hypothetical protein n=1 Tax=Enterococcus cecorum TaxID=44008 RepID=UPI00148C59F0|nr:hypothetical protein [Enterococcus cecorum]MCJ0574764.1 hypothetical protein [Enterococcus cecorum]MCJ0576625.1 hypothetical protein [Enterococcus cecorum]MCJ0597970.1 hypothetical protein [Enterococcus cecorum]MCJ0601191.1 hypothetical protein [Enterococcus cecorum]MCJ0606501.1 hypothetical protein [Enterococcus cecorum]
MSQSQIVPVKLADNEKNRKNEDTHKKSPQKLWAHIKSSSGAEVRLFQGVSPQLAKMILEKI